MEIQLQELINQIKKDGVETANAQAESILSSAKAEAEKTENTSIVAKEFPAYHSETIIKNNLTIVFDASVEAVNKEQFLIPKVYPQDFTDDDVGCFITTFFKNATITSLMNPLTKSEYERLYLHSLQEISKVESDSPDIDLLKAQCEYYKERMNNAVLDKKDIIPYEPDVLQQFSYGKALRSAADIGEENPAVLQVTVAPGQNSMVFDKGIEYMDVSMSYPEFTIQEPKGIQMSKSEAQGLADELISKITDGNYDCAAYMVGVVSKHGLYDTVNDFVQQCHRFVYTEKFDDIGVTYTSKNETAVPDEMYNTIPSKSYIAVCIDDGGIASVQWEGKNKVVGYEEPVKLLDFNNIMERSKNGLYATYAWDAEGDIDSIAISYIKLGYMPILQANTNEYNLMIPVWDFFGSINPEFNKVAGYNSLLTINAITGAIVDRNIGY